MLENAGTTTLLIRRLRNVAILVFKSIHGFNPSHLNGLFDPKVSNYYTRRGISLIQPRQRTRLPMDFGL